MFGTVVNALAIIVGSLAGTLLKGGMAERYHRIVIHAVGLAVILIGIRSALKSDALLLVIISLAVGSICGEWLKITDRLEAFGEWLEKRLSRSGGDFAKGFVTASLVFCVGSMAIVGSLESGLTGNHQTLLAKSVLDGITSVIFAASFGIGVLLSSAAVFIYQGIITVGAVWIKPLLIPDVVNQMTAVGGLLIMAIGINLLDIKQIKVANMLPALAVPLVVYLVKRLVVA